ncbi:MULTISPECIES: DUF4190 domain-containing protein [unclassified Streptomyces]|uniref:DUF4190 domain-containing protein n=1 Tax=unclassified Streptomyces TaxID=2593676 RepID=UPI000CD598CB|nr:MULTISPECIES: DUF4190 domain-containing protein [unclassified Streptomyces]AWL40867.1 DUF4190 domain-containing protein [Streptomyces sp. SM18]
MSDNTQQPGGGPAPHDPWAPPENRVELGKPTGAPRPPGVHDQPTVTAAPGPDPGAGPMPAPPAGGFAPPPGGDVPPPPVAPNGPGWSGAQYGYPATPPAPAPAPPYAGYPGYPGYGGQPAWGGPAPANGLGVAAMVLGIVGVVGFCMWGIGIVLGVLALVFGIVGHGRVKRGEADNGGMALAGIILGSVSIVIGGVFLVLLIIGVTDGGSSGEEYGYDDPFATSLVVGAGR